MCGAGYPLAPNTPYCIQVTYSRTYFTTMIAGYGFTVYLLVHSLSAEGLYYPL